MLSGISVSGLLDAVCDLSYYTTDWTSDTERTSAYGTRAFSVAGPVCCNALPDYLKSSDLSFDCFKHQLKHLSFVITTSTVGGTLETSSMRWLYRCIY